MTMTVKQQIRFNELSKVMKQLVVDIERKHWNDLSDDEKNKLWVKYYECMNRLEKSLNVEDDLDTAA